jgi:heparosan-N-sulfate-glucuronate 5-epimerase
MFMLQKLQYYRRIFTAYLGIGESQLTFWHDTPKTNPRAMTGEIGEYYMDFSVKADYQGHHDAGGVPMLNYRGAIGLQYNPIAIAQWGLGNYDIWRRAGKLSRRENLLTASYWLCKHLEQNSKSVWVWQHHFDWEYRQRLKAPWYSGLAQGQGISLLLRAYKETNEQRFAESAERAFTSFCRPVAEGGVAFTDECGDLWFEEYIVSPPTHILNGFIWAIWGVYDYFLVTGDPAAGELFERSVNTLRRNLPHYDLGFWSLYERSGTWMPMVASPFYHRLHIVQLQVMHRLTGDEFFAEYAERWQAYFGNWAKRARAVCYKTAFKLCYY